MIEHSTSMVKYNSPVYKKVQEKEFLEKYKEE
jgi:hypothetical protein